MTLDNKYDKIYIFDKDFNILFKSQRAEELEKLNPDFIKTVTSGILEITDSFGSFARVVNVGPNGYPMLFSVVNKNNEYEVYCSYDYSRGFNKISRSMTIINIGFLDYDSKRDVITRIYFHGKNFLLNVTREELFKNNALKINPDDLKGFQEAFEKFRKGKFKDVCYFRSTFFSGKMKWYSFEDIEPSPENPNALHGCIRDIDRFTVEREKIIEKGTHDSLTGLYNRQGMVKYINSLLKPLPDEIYFLGEVNIDGFKGINDSYGRVFGDEVIKAVAYAIKKNLSSSGVVARIGADDFLFIDKFKTDDQMEIRPILRNLKMDLDSLKIMDVDNVNISTTTGVVSYPKDGTIYDDLEDALKKASYRGKMKGGNCYIIYSREKHGDIDINEKIYNSFSKNVKFNNNQFISDTINKFINSNNISKTIDTLLKDLCEHFIVDRIVLSDKFGNIYSQATVNDYPKLNEFYKIAYEDEYKNQFNKDNIRFNNYIDRTDIGFGLLDLKEAGVKAFIQVKLYEENEFSGYISFEDLTDRRVWSTSDIAFVNTISKIIGAFYVKDKVETKLNDSLYKDPITGYINLNKFKLEASKMDILENSKVFLNIDIRKFTRINDTYGFRVGDRILKMVADTINSFITTNELFCRLGDDKFGIILDYINEENIEERLEVLYTLLVRNVSLIIPENIDFSCGTYVIVPDENISSIIDKSNYARKISKKTGKRYVVYDSKLLEVEQANKVLESRMNESLENGDFIVYFQPCYYIKTRKVCSMEALVRWKLDGEIVPPIKFIPLFENNGFITKLDFYVYETVCKTINKYQSLGYNVPTISVNVSRRHIDNPNFLSDLNALLDKYNIKRSNIGLELTESLFVENEGLMLSFVESLHNAGYRIYMDDFGVAYSTLNLIGRMHVDVIKLDKSFIDDTAYNPNETIIISNIIRMAKELGIRVLSEGIETEIQLDQLSKMSCDYAQGYWFAKPKPAEEIFPKYLEEPKYVESKDEQIV
ncbi:MAG: EAL domain-containing protein [Anaeroplasmataceae bacterium]